MHLEVKEKTKLGVFLWKILKSNSDMYISLHICLLLLEFGDNSLGTGWGHSCRTLATP